MRLELCELAHTACILPKAARALFSLQLIDIFLRTAVCSDHAVEKAEASNKLNRASVHDDMVCVVMVDSHGLGLRVVDL